MPNNLWNLINIYDTYLLRFNDVIYENPRYVAIQCHYLDSKVFYYKKEENVLFNRLSKVASNPLGLRNHSNIVAIWSHADMGDMAKRGDLVIKIPTFFKKQGTQYQLGLLARSINGEDLPVKFKIEISKAML